LKEEKWLKEARWMARRGGSMVALGSDPAPLSAPPAHGNLCQSLGRSPLGIAEYLRLAFEGQHKYNKRYTIYSSENNICCK
jgi:hypothetical protein